MLLLKNKGSVARNTCFCLNTTEASRGIRAFTRRCRLPRLGFKLPRTGFKLPRLGFKLPRTGFKLPRLGFKLPRTRFKLPRLGFKLPRPGFKLPRLGFKLPRTGFKLPRLGFKLSLLFKQKHVFRATLPQFLTKSTYSARRFRCF